LAHFGVCALEADGAGLDVPPDAVLGKAGMEGHAAVFVVYAEHAGESVLKRDYGAVENAVGVREKVSGNDGIGGIAP
jgi:hypothetical protein